MTVHKFSIKEALSKGFEIFKKNWKFILLSLIIVFVVRMILGGIVGGIDQGLNMGGGFEVIVNWFLDSFLTMGAVIISLKLIDGKKAEYSDLYKHYPLYLKYLLGSVLVSLILLVPIVIATIGNNLGLPILAFIGFAAIIFPGIYLSIKYQFTTYLIIDKKMHPIDAFKKSGHITQGVKLKLFLFSLAQIGVVLLGLVALVVGLLVAIPVAFLASTYVYRKLSPHS